MSTGSFVRIWLEPDDDGTAELFVEAATGAFAGKGSAWFNDSEIRAFASRLTAYPLPAGDPPTLQGGRWSNDTRGVLVQKHVMIKVYPATSTGQVGVRVELAEPLFDDERPESQCSAAVEVLTTDNRLAEFGANLQRVADGALPSATLEGERLL